MGGSTRHENDDWFMIRHEKLKAVHQEMSNMFAEEPLSYDHISQLMTEYLLTIKEAHR